MAVEKIREESRCEGEEIELMSQDANVMKIQQARDELISRYDLGDNCDVLVARADELYAAYKWEECYAVTSK